MIPLALRRQVGLAPGTELEVEVDEYGIRLRRAMAGAELAVKDGRLVARPRAAVEGLPKVDAAQWIERERDR